MTVMKRTTELLCLLVAVTAGCTSVQRAVESPATEGETRSNRWESGATVPLLAMSLPTTRATSHLSELELSIFNGPDFQRRFAESYLSEVDIEPRVDEDEVQEMQQVMELIAADDLDAAARMIEERRDGSSSAVYDFTLANIHFQREELVPAANNYELAVGKYPKFRRAWRNLGVIRIRQEDFPKAIPALTRVIELGGADAITYGLLGFAYANLEKNLTAESAYRMALLLDPETMDWKMGLARTLFKQERFADAASLCGNLIAEYPERGDLWLLQANAFIGLEQPLHAAENYELVDRLGQSTAESLNTLGDIYANEGLFELAVDSYTRALAKPGCRPDRAIRAARMMAARNALDATDQVVNAIEASAGSSLETSQRKALLKLHARLAVARGATGEETRALEEIVALDPLDGEALILLGQHHDRAGESEKAIFYFERAANIESCEADAKVRHAQLLVRQGKYAEALPLLRSAQVVKPRSNIQEYLEQVERVAGTRSK